MTSEEFKEALDLEYARIMFGDGSEQNFGGFLSTSHTPETATVPDILTRQLRRQQRRLNSKGREL